MEHLVVDTHALLWYLFEPAKLSEAARGALEATAFGGKLIHIPAISLVEIRYLVEKGRIPAAAEQQLHGLLRDCRDLLALVPLGEGVINSLPFIPRDIVPELPDRIVAATAHSLGLPLVTRDHQIRAAGITTIW